VTSHDHIRNPIPSGQEKAQGNVVSLLLYSAVNPGRKFKDCCSRFFRSDALPVAKTQRQVLNSGNGHEAMFTRKHS